MKTVNDLKAGDTVWFTDVNRMGLFETTVAKVGSKLITITGYRAKTFRKDTLRANDEYQHQTLILDKAEYLEDQEKEKILLKIATGVRQVDRSKINLDNLYRASYLLGIRIND